MSEADFIIKLNKSMLKKKIIETEKNQTIEKLKEHIRNINNRNSRQRIQLKKIQEELKKEKEKNKELDYENQALYNSINLEDDNTLVYLYKIEKEKNEKLEEDKRKMLVELYKANDKYDKLIKKLKEENTDE